MGAEAWTPSRPSSRSHRPRVAPCAGVLCAVVAAGVAAASCTVFLALTSDHIPEPGVHAALQVWGMLGFFLAGVVAWWRRPESRFGVLMVLAGVAWFLSSLSSANLAVPYTVGIAFDLLPAVRLSPRGARVPDGRLERFPERAFVAVGYVTALVVHLLGMTLGGFGPDNLLELASRGGASHRLQNAQLIVLSALCVAGIGVLAFRRRDAGPPLRRSLALLVDAFALALVMIAFLYLSAVFGLVSGETTFETIRRVDVLRRRSRAASSSWSACSTHVWRAPPWAISSSSSRPTRRRRICATPCPVPCATHR